MSFTSVALKETAFRFWLHLINVSAAVTFVGVDGFGVAGPHLDKVGESRFIQALRVLPDVPEVMALLPDRPQVRIRVYVLCKYKK